MHIECVQHLDTPVPKQRPIALLPALEEAARCFLYPPLGARELQCMKATTHIC